MNKLEPYATYKPTTIPWLEGLPTSWSDSRLGYETWVRARLGWKGLKADEYVDEGIAFLSTPNIKGRVIDFEQANFITQERYDESPEIRLSTGDVLLAKDGSTLGTVNVVRNLPRPTTVNSSIAVLTPGPRCDGRYVNYLIQSELIQSRIEMLKGGMGVPHLFQDDIRRMPIPLPPLEVQSRIVDYLDHETSQIDDLIGKQERLIELLAEKRKALITRVVTKGLDPTAVTKPSGVPWLGDIPSHWMAVPVKWLSRLTTGITPPTANEDNFPEEETPYPWIRPEDLDESGRPTQASKFLSLEAWNACRPVRADAVLICCIGATLGKAGLIRKAAVTNQQITAVESEMVGAYLFAAIGAARQEIEAMSVGNTLPILNTSRLGMLSVPVPPAPEQLAIAQYIETKSNEIDQLSAKCRSAIQLLCERRSALISAAVIGRIDVQKRAS